MTNFEMNNNDSDSEKDIICRCSGTTTGQIKKHIDKGVNNLESLSHATGACSGCGACDTDIMAMIDEYISSVTRMNDNGEEMVKVSQ